MVVGWLVALQQPFATRLQHSLRAGGRGSETTTTLSLASQNEPGGIRSLNFSENARFEDGYIVLSERISHTFNREIKDAIGYLPIFICI